MEKKYEDYCKIDSERNPILVHATCVAVSGLKDMKYPKAKRKKATPAHWEVCEPRSAKEVLQDLVDALESYRNRFDKFELKDSQGNSVHPQATPFIQAMRWRLSDIQNISTIDPWWIDRLEHAMMWIVVYYDRFMNFAFINKSKNCSHHRHARYLFCEAQCVIYNMRVALKK